MMLHNYVHKLSVSFSNYALLISSLHSWCKYLNTCRTISRHEMSCLIILKQPGPSTHLAIIIIQILIWINLLNQCTPFISHVSWEGYQLPNNFCPHYVFADVSSDDPADWRTYCIYHRETASPHYVCADVSSEYSGHWMTFYICHRKMAGHHYVIADVSSDDPAYQTTYYIHRSKMAGHKNVCVDVSSG
jgi:hypothetical protein